MRRLIGGGLIIIGLGLAAFSALGQIGLPWPGPGAAGGAGGGGACTVTGSGNTTALFRSYQRYIITSTNAAAVNCPSSRSVQYCLVAGAGGADSTGTGAGGFGGGGGGGMLVGQATTLSSGGNSVTIGSPTVRGSLSAPGGFPGSGGNGGSAGNGGGGGGFSPSGDAGGGGGGGGAIGTSGATATSGISGSGGSGSWCIADDTQYSGGSGGTGGIAGSAGAGAQTPKAVFWEAPPISTPTLFINASVTGGVTSFSPASTAAITGGNLAVIAVAYQSIGSAGVVSSISDGVGAYTKANNANPSTTFHVDVWYKLNATTVPSGTTTVISTGQTPNGQKAYVFGVQASGITAFDTSSIACSGATPALAQVNELAIGIGGASTAAGSNTPPANWSNLGYSGVQSGAGAAVDTLANINLTNKNGVIYSLGSGLSGTSGCVLAMFKGN